MDPRGLTLVQLAVQLMTGASRYRDASLGNVVDEVLNEVELAAMRLDHPAECAGCGVCQNQDAVAIHDEPEIEGVRH